MSIMERVVGLDPWSITGILARIVVGILLILPGASYVLFAVSIVAALLWGIGELITRMVYDYEWGEKSSLGHHLKRLALWSVDLIAWTLLGDRETPIHPWVNA